jgi:hypothetical protein
LQRKTPLNEVDSFLEKMKEEYSNRGNYSEAARILRRKSVFSKREYLSLAVEKGDDFRTLKKTIFMKDDPEDNAILNELVIPKLELQVEIMLTDNLKKIVDIQNKKQRLKLVKEMKRENTFVTVSITLTSAGGS